MVQIGGDSSMTFLALVTIVWMVDPVSSTGSSNSIKKERPYFARLSTDLKELAQMDFETMVNLKRFHEENPGQPLPLVNIVNK